MTDQLTFIIPVRIDSEARRLNLQLVLEYLGTAFPLAFFMVMEGDSRPWVTNLPSNPRIKYLFEKDNDPVFYRTRYLNWMTALATTPIVAVWDTDVLVAREQVETALRELLTGEADFVIPYDGKIWQVPPLIRDLYRERADFSVLTAYVGSLSLMYGTNSYGGCFMVNREKYIEAGMENEHFYGWGPEDLERVKRWEILGYRIHRGVGAGFHFQHPVLENSRSSDPEMAVANNRELFRICALTAGELRREVSTWKWRGKLYVEPKI